jgi:hypothetical protein
MVWQRQMEHNGDHLWDRPFVTINKESSHDGDSKTFEVIRSTLALGTELLQFVLLVGTIAAWFAVTLYQGMADRKHKLWNIILTDIYVCVCVCMYIFAVWCWNVDIKTYISNVVNNMNFWNKLLRVHSKSKDWKAK